MRHIQNRIGVVVGIIVLVVTLYSVVLSGDLALENREALVRDLTNLSIRAQEYYRRSTWNGGGGGTFAGLTADHDGMKKLAAKHITPNGWVDILTAGDHTSVEFQGVGTQLGNDANLIKIYMLVFPDSTALTYIN